MKSIQQKGTMQFYTSLSLCLVLVLLLAMGCQKDSGPSLPIPQNLKADSVLVVWLKPEKTKEDFERWFKDSIQALGRVSLTETCASCDGKLKRLTGPAIVAFISGHPATGGVSSGKRIPASGDNGPVYISLDYSFSFKTDIIDTFSSVAPTPAAPRFYKDGTIVKVAVFDTGLDTAGFTGSYLYQSVSTPCIDNADNGWNFAGNNLHTADDHAGKHGTTVSQFIIEQVAKYSGNPVQILPVKTHNSEGAATLFDILCGFAYAQQRGVQIINASFGFYLPRLEIEDPVPFRVDQGILLLREYVKYYLTDNNILLITAAGNKMDMAELQSFRDYGLSPEGRNLRDLDQVSFYPASLARDPGLPNVVAVTTLDPTGRQVSPNQNFSEHVVDIGVKADEKLPDPTGDRFIFLNRRSSRLGATVEGSSFATPIVTGKLCANYYLYKHLLAPGLRVNKEDIMNIFLDKHLIGRSSLLGTIKDGNLMSRY